MSNRTAPTRLGRPGTARTMSFGTRDTLALDGVGISDPEGRITLSLNGTGDARVGPVSGALVSMAGNNTVPCAIILAGSSQFAALEAGKKLTLAGNITGAYALTPEELAAGSFTNTAMASGYAPDGTTVTASDSDVQVFWPVGPTLLVDDPDGGSGAGLTTLGGADPLCITLALAAGPYAGMLADWWLVALPHQGSEWYYLDANAGWIGVPAGQAGALQPFYQGPLTSLRFPVSLFCAAALAPGQYTLVFAVDPLDGLINYPGGPILYDTKTLTR